MDRQEKLLNKFKHRILDIGEKNSLYQPFDKLTNVDKTRDNVSKKEKQRDPYRLDKTKEKIKTVVPRQVQYSNYKIHQVLLDSSDRNISTFPHPNHFVLKVANFYRNVFAVRILKSELLYNSNVIGNGVYMSLNDYKHIARNETQDTLALFSRITPGVCDFSCVTTNILDDPYTHILNPMEPKMQRFEIKLYENDNTLKIDSHFTLILHLALFCYS
jgi:hypothetical protein